MFPLHSRLSTNELANTLGTDVAAIQADRVLETANGWLALVSSHGFVQSPDRVQAKLHRPIWDAQPWWKKLMAGTKRWPPQGWLVAAEVESGSWIWLGTASCHAWSQGKDGEPMEGDLNLEARLPRELFLTLRNGDPWIDCGSGLGLPGSFDTPASQRLHLIMQQDKGDVFLQRWEGESFGLQFDEKRSVFFVMPEAMNSMTYRYGACPEAACMPETDTTRIEMHCPCCGIDLGPFRPELHMSRDFGFFVLSWLLDHHELPCLWTANTGQAIEWPETDALSGA